MPAAALPSFRTPEILGALENAFPQFQAGGDVLSTSLENIGAVFHPALTLLNAGWIEETRGDFEYYHQGITPAVASVLQRIDDERLAVARALGVRTVSAREWLYLAYDSSGDDLCAAIRATSRNIFFTAEAHATVAAITSHNQDRCFINKLHFTLRNSFA